MKVDVKLKGFKQVPLSSYKAFSQGDIKGWMREELWTLLPTHFFEDPVSSAHKMGGKVIRESRLRWAAILTLSDGNRIFLKKDNTKGWIEGIKYLILPSKGRKEWFISRQLRGKNLPIPEPLGWMEKIHRGLVKESYYFSEAVGSGISLIEDPVKLEESFILLEMARMIKKIHGAGLFHKDLHAGNFIWDDSSLYLVDLHRAKMVKTLSLGQKLWNLAFLFQSLRSVWEERCQSLFLDAYFERESPSLPKKRELLQTLHRQMDRLQMTHWKSRTKRCLKESSDFSVEAEGETTYFHRRDFPLDVLKEAVSDHRRCVSERSSELLKFSSEVTVSKLGRKGQKLSVKNYHPSKLRDRFKEHFRRSKGMRAWISGNGLSARGVTALKPFGLAEKRDWLGLRESFFVMEVLEGAQELDRYVINGLNESKERKRFVKRFAQWLSHCHGKRLYHRDMKTCNMLVLKDGEGWNFYFLDLEDIRFDKRVSERDLFKNFLQLNTSSPKIITTRDRFRFFRDYLALCPIVRDKKSFLRRLIGESKQRDLVYVSPQGTVIERL
jgi:tRNA A-37 threonylcarbamoyl transferase component Bud32